MRIIVAFDRTEGSQAALLAAAEVARACSGTLLVVHALNPLTDAVDVYASSNHEALEIKIHEERKALHDAVLSLSDVSSEVWVEEQERGEDVAGALLRVAKGHDANLIAIASRRAASLRGALLGSVASAVVQHSDRPVLLVRPQSLP
jgi:nucleotide-binding universal stress UspA family protein